MRPIYLLLLLSLTFITACDKKQSKLEKDARAFVLEWNELHTEIKTPFLKTKYMDVVQYYGVERTNFKVEQHKKILFEDFPNYKQTIKDDEVVVTKEGADYLVVFVKEIEYGDVKAAYNSFLLLTLSNSRFKILSEGVVGKEAHLNIPVFPYNLDKRLAASENRQLFGDFNGDDLSDHAYVESPVLMSVSENEQSKENVICEDGCNSILHFSAKDLSSIKIEDAYKSDLENLKDLNGDGADEIGFWSIKPNSKSLYIFDPTSGALLTSPVYINTKVHKNMKLIDVIKKSGSKKITVTRSVQRTGTWVLEDEIIKLD
jgi:hypothetical protein